MIDEIKGKYTVIDNRSFKITKNTVEQPILLTDNCREAVWIANKDPQKYTPKNLCGERDFYKGEDNRWHSFEL